MGKELIRSLLDSQDENGMFRVMTTDEFGHAYANYALWAIYRFLIFHEDAVFAREILPSVKAYIKAHEKLHAFEEGDLQIERVHQLTGKEYQPSYWYFSEYPADYGNPETYTWLKRVDRSVYHYLNLMGTAGVCRLCGDEGEILYKEKAECLKQEINDKNVG